MRLLDSGRERKGGDLTKVRLRHYQLHTDGRAPMVVRAVPPIVLQLMKAAGQCAVQEKEKALLSKTIERVNELFAGNVGEDDRLRYVYHVREKMLE